jgi:hypothetical protein
LEIAVAKGCCKSGVSGNGVFPLVPKFWRDHLLLVRDSELAQTRLEPGPSFNALTDGGVGRLRNIISRSLACWTAVAQV